MDRLSVPEIILKHSLRYIPVIVAFAGLAIVPAGCSDSRMAANNAASNNDQVQQSNYQVGYGLSSEGPTTDLYTELKGSLQRPERPQATGPVQQAAGPVPQAAPAGSVQQGTTAGVNGQPVADSRPAAVQQPAAPPREEPTATVYGMSSDGPTTDVYSALFGPRSR
jgi:hypothetical protein